MITYYIRAPYPIDSVSKEAFALEHRTYTNNELSIIRNADDTESFIKVTTYRLPEEFIPQGFVYSEVVESRDVVLYFLSKPEWQKTLI